MHIKQASIEVIEQLILIIDKIKPDDYRKIIPSLNASVGQHFRHVIEFYFCLFEGIDQGTINYDNRKHDLRIETDVEIAKNLLFEIKDKVGNFNSDPILKLEINYHYHLEFTNILKTYYTRELAYNIEHTIHHMAIIKSAFQLFPYINLPDDFGIASSTIRYRNQSLKK